MKKIISLTKVFSKEFYQSLPIFNKEKKKLNKKSLFFWLIVIIFLGVTYVSHEIITFLIDAGKPEIFLNLYFFVLGILLLFQAILVCTNVFFFSKDIENVLHMPLKPVELLVAKLNTLVAMLYASEGILALIPFTLYGLLTHAHFLYYLWEIVILLVFPIFLAILVSIVLLLIMRFAKFIKNKDTFQLIITIIMIITICILESKMMMGLFSIQNDEQVLQQFNSFSEKAKQVGSYFLVINPSVMLLSKPASIEAILSLTQLLGYNVVASIIFITIGKRTYLKDIIKNRINYTNKKKTKIEIEKNTKVHSIKKAYLIKEVKGITREPIYFMQCVFPVMILLITIILIVMILMPTVTKILQDETVNQLLKNLSFNTEVVCDILVVLQVLFSLSNLSLTAISREGKNATFMKHIPIELYKQFVYKNIPQIMLNFIVTLVILGMIWYLVPSINLFYLFMIGVIAFLINLINSYLMLIVDLRRPNLDWDSNTSVVKKSENKIFQYAFLIISVLVLIYIANIFKSTNIINALIGEMLIFAIVFIIIDRVVKKRQNKLFNKII